MRKDQITMKQVKGMYPHIIQLGYCEAQTLLRHRNRTWYTSGAYGWNADVYNWGGIAIVTGYRPFGNIRPDYDLVKEYEEKAKQLYKEEHNYDELNNKAEELLKEFITKVF